MISNNVSFNVLTAIPGVQQIVGGGYAVRSFCSVVSSLAKCAFSKCQIASREHAPRPNPSQQEDLAMLQQDISKKMLENAKKRHIQLRKQLKTDFTNLIEGIIRATPVIGTGYSIYHLRANVAKLKALENEKNQPLISFLTGQSVPEIVTI